LFKRPRIGPVRFSPANRTCQSETRPEFLSSDHGGSLTIYIQSDAPSADRQANWLPPPKEGGFKLALGLYAPNKEVSDGTCMPERKLFVDFISMKVQTEPARNANAKRSGFPFQN